MTVQSIPQLGMDEPNPPKNQPNEFWPGPDPDPDPVLTLANVLGPAWQWQF